MMKLDGYTPPDMGIALDTGIELKYTTSLGSFTFQTRMAGTENATWKAAMRAFESKKAIALRGVKSANDDVEKENEKTFLGMIHDILIISWSTTATGDGGKPFKSTRETFLYLFSLPVLGQVVTELTGDMANTALFAKEEEAAAAKN